jgi:hypothetical protein
VFRTAAFGSSVEGRVVVAGLTVWSLVAVAFGATGAVIQHHDSVIRIAQANYTSALQVETTVRARAAEKVASANEAVANARTALDGSDGKVLSEASRTALLGSIIHSISLITAAQSQLQQDRTVGADKPAGTSFWGDDYYAAAKDLNTYRYSAASRLDSVTASLIAPTKAVTDAVTAWTAEQARIAAAKAAAAAAAAAQAAAASRAASVSVHYSAPARRSSGTVEVASSSGAVFTLNAWTSGWQAQIDACRGAVDITAHYGVRTLAEHSECGGSAVPKSPGAVIRVTGVDAGLYRVDGVVANLNGNTATSNDLPRGYDLLFQTCVNGYSNMSFTGLTRIG